jgi:adenine-specific DNA-methyltransferase
MSTNISKQKRKDLTDKIKAIHKYIATAKQDENTRNMLAWLSEIEKEINAKKFGLVFEEHREAIDETLETHTPVLTENKKLFIDNGGQINFLIEGDNLSALQLLLKTHKGKIDVIYIDPPYNRGDNDFIYDDNYIDKNDTFRHSKYCSFLSKRLKIAKALLIPHGTIFISCDDNEQASIKYILDTIFGEQNFEGHIHWRRRHNQPNDMTKLIGLVAEHILVYSKDSIKLKKVGVGKVGLTGKFSNPDNDSRGPWASKPWKAGSNQSGTKYTITTPTGKVYDEEWLGDTSTYNKLLKDKRIIFPKNGNGSPRKKYFQFEREEEGQCATNWFPSDTFGNNQDATDELKLLFNGNCPFDNPKPTTLIKNIINLGSIKNNAVVLDFFAGSGTTGHAVLELNKTSGSRKFILCTNNENNICRDVTYERIKRVIKKEDYAASLKYYKIDYIPISDRLYYEYADELLGHIRELVELENGINFSGNDKIAIVLTEAELDDFVKNIRKYKNCRKLYRAHNVLVSAEQAEKLKTARIKVNVIPDYYYGELET